MLLGAIHRECIIAVPVPAARASYTVVFHSTSVGLSCILLVSLNAFEAED